jgi:hypothetical protein
MNDDIRGGVVRESSTDATYTTDTNFGNSPEPDDFPIGALPRASRQLLREAAASIGCPADFVGVPMLVALASAIGNSRVLKLKGGWEEGATIYAASIGLPGTKKTPAYKEAIRPATSLQAKFYRDYQQQLRLDEAEHEEGSQDSEAPTLQRTWVGDATVEALTSILGTNKRGVLVIRDELSGWVRSMNQYKQGKGADRQFFLEAWSNSPYSVDRRNTPAPIILERPFICLYGTIQPEVLSELDIGKDDGLLDRFLFACPFSQLVGWTEDEISEEARDDYHRLYVKLRELEMNLDEDGNPNPKRVLCAPKAKAVFADLMNELVTEVQEPGFPRSLRGPWAKIPGHLARLSLVLALCRAVDSGEPENVESRDVLAAMVLLDYFKNQARRVYVGLYGEDPDDRLAADVAAFLRERDSYWKGSATELHEQLPSSIKPESPDVLSKKLGEIADHTPALSVKHGWAGRSRVLVLSLQNGVGGVGGVGQEQQDGTAGTHRIAVPAVDGGDDCECGGRGCVDCLAQELPFGPSAEDEPRFCGHGSYEDCYLCNPKHPYRMKGNEN